MRSPWLCRHDMRTGSGIMHEEFAAFPTRKAFFAQTHLQAASARPHARHFQGCGYISLSVQEKSIHGSLFSGQDANAALLRPSASRLERPAFFR